MTSKLSPVGMLCNDILSAISAIPEFPADAGTFISGCVGHILQMTRKNDERMLSARRAIAALKRDLRGTKEQLAVLRQEHFGPSSEKEPPQDEDEDTDYFLDGLVEEPNEMAVGKRSSKKPQDMTTEIHNIYPDDRTCCTCGCEMPSIGNWASEKFQIIPEHVICIRKIHHKCACNREVCKDNKPVAAKSQSYMMKGCKYEAEFMLEAAVQKFDEHSTTYRMESRFKNSNLNVSRQVIGRNIARIAGFLKPIQDELLAHVTAAMSHIWMKPRFEFRLLEKENATLDISGRSAEMSAAGIQTVDQPFFTNMQTPVRDRLPQNSLQAPQFE